MDMRIFAPLARKSRAAAPGKALTIRYSTVYSTVRGREWNFARAQVARSGKSACARARKLKADHVRGGDKKSLGVPQVRGRAVKFDNGN